MSVPSLFLSDEAWPCCWLLEISDRKLGVHAHDGWCMQAHGRVLAIDPDIMCIHLLPVLELPAQDFLELNDPALQQTLKAELAALTLNKVMPQGSRQTAKRMIRNLSAVSV